MASASRPKFGLGLGLEALASASASRFWPRPGFDLVVLLCNWAFFLQKSCKIRGNFVNFSGNNLKSYVVNHYLVLFIISFGLRLGLEVLASFNITGAYPSPYSTTDVAVLVYRMWTRMCLCQVDDFLYVTPSYDNALTFLTLMLRGVPEYNCHINHSKTLVNFHVDSSAAAGSVPCLAAGALFPWCGLLIDTSTLAVVADFTRYAGICMSDTLTIDLSRNAGRTMRNKLLFSLRARCHRIFFDAALNSAAVENAYRVFVLAAFKMHVYAAHLPSGPQRNPAFFVDVVFEVARFVASFTTALAVDDGLLESPPLQWLCLEAFRRKLGRHGGVYGAVLRVIGRRQTALELRLDECRMAELKRIVDGDDLPYEFHHVLP